MRRVVPLLQPCTRVGLLSSKHCARVGVSRIPTGRARVMHYDGSHNKSALIVDAAQPVV